MRTTLLPTEVLGLVSLSSLSSCSMRQMYGVTDAHLGPLDGRHAIVVDGLRRSSRTWRGKVKQSKGIECRRSRKRKIWSIWRRRSVVDSLQARQRARPLQEMNQDAGLLPSAPGSSLTLTGGRNVLACVPSQLHAAPRSNVCPN